MYFHMELGFVAEAINRNYTEKGLEAPTLLGSVRELLFEEGRFVSEAHPLQILAGEGTGSPQPEDIKNWFGDKYSWNYYYR